MVHEQHKRIRLDRVKLNWTDPSSEGILEAVSDGPQTGKLRH